MVNREFWKGKKVFLTGDTGFKGAWMRLWLEDMGAIVKGYALPPEGKENLYSIVEYDYKASLFDIRNYNSLFMAIEYIKPDIVIHMAAQALVKRGYENPISTFDTNIIGTANLLEIIRNNPSIKAALFITTDKVYERSCKINDETNTIKGHDPYSTSKVCAEMLVDCYQQSMGVKTNLATARAGNVIGGGDFGQYRLIPDAIRARNKGEILKIRNPTAIRPWSYVLDILSGYLMLCEKLYCYDGVLYQSPWNFGAEHNDITVANLLELIEIPYEVTQGTFSEAEILQLCSDKSKEFLGWKPIHIKKAIALTKDWYNAYSNKENMKDYSLMQIHNYESGIYHG